MFIPVMAVWLKSGTEWFTKHRQQDVKCLLMLALLMKFYSFRIPH